MSQVRLENYTLEEQGKLLKKFFSTISLLGSYQEVADFFKDLLSKKEMAMLARRLKAAQLLEDGLTFDEVAVELDMGKSTISRINFWINAGSGGYKTAIKKLNEIESSQERKRKKRSMTNKLYSIPWLLNKYNALTADDIRDIAVGIDDYLRIKRKRKIK